MVPISNIVGVSIGLAAAAVQLSGFGQLLFVTNETGGFDLSERVRTYGDLAGVLEDWDTDSEVATAATSYYSQTPSPTTFMVGLASDVDSAATLTGGLPAAFIDQQNITAGGFTITVDGNEQVVSGVDLSGATTEADVVATMNGILADAALSYEDGKYVITTTNLGEGASVSFAVDDVEGLASALGLLSTSGAVVADALSKEDPVAALAEIADHDPSFYGVVLHKQWRDSEASKDVASYVQATTRVFFNTTNDARALTTQSGDILSDMQALTYTRTLSSYSSTPDEYPSAAVAGRAFTVNFEGTNTTITLFLKQLPGVTVENLTVSQKANLEAKNGNVVLNVGGTNVYSDSRMASGHWFDTIHGVDWLQNRIETDVFNLSLQATEKIPYTDSGVSKIRQAVEGGLRQGVTNGLIAPGTLPDGEYLPLGYDITVIPVSDVSSSLKSGRHYAGVSFRAVGAGAIHTIQITGTFSE